MNDNLNLLKSLEQIRETIYDECQKNAYFAPKEYRQCYERILNASMTLYDDVLGMICDNSAIGLKTNLPLSKLIELQKEILSILFESENIITKEKMIRKLFSKQKISPKNYFKLNTKISELLPSASLID